MRQSFITDHTIISSLGFDSKSNFEQLKKSHSGIKKHQRENGDNYYSSIVDKAKVDKLYSMLDDVDAYTRLEKMMILSIKNRDSNFIKYIKT